ncbi:glycosyltransferase, partial [Pseudomonas sp. 2995-1]|uniref:glycosyltransferase n=1 Tax=Pseudomonas sp. 2995-1 TaxID=1712679 RepID=UPI0013042AEA
PIAFEEMGNIFAEADLVINSSYEEGQSTAVCEAMGLGVPVIVRKNAGNCSVVTHEKTGFVYEDPTQFIDLVKEAW